MVYLLWWSNMDVFLKSNCILGLIISRLWKIRHVVCFDLLLLVDVCFLTTLLSYICWSKQTGHEVFLAGKRGWHSNLSCWDSLFSYYSEEIQIQFIFDKSWPCDWSTNVLGRIYRNFHKWRIASLDNCSALLDQSF